MEENISSETKHDRRFIIADDLQLSMCHKKSRSLI
jgi:hypothetical protein